MVISRKGLTSGEDLGSFEGRVREGCSALRARVAIASAAGAWQCGHGSRTGQRRWSKGR